MSRTRNVLGLVAAAILLLSSCAHSIMGWPAVRAQLAAVSVPPDLMFGMQVGWLFGGVCMVAFAIIVAALFLRRLRGESVSTLPAIVIGLAYVAFGAWALIGSNFDLFFLIFIVPGVLLLIAGTGSRTTQRA